jgi:hypothetical protein
VLLPDGSQVFDVQRSGRMSDAISIGESAGRQLLTRLPAGILAA